MPVRSPVAEFQLSRWHRRVWRRNSDLTATVCDISRPGTVPTGVVEFREGSTVLGSGVLDSNGRVSVTLTTLAVGPHAITAVYAGDTNFDSSTSAPLNQSVNLAPTSTTLGSSLSPSTYGQSVTFTATVHSSIADVPGGTVVFMDGSTVLGSATLSPDGRLNLLYTHNNLEGHERLVKALDESLDGFADHRHPRSQHHFQLSSLLPLYGTAHQLGTVKFGKDPKSSVLDPWCKAHELDNLYVTDTSFFVTSAAVNPTLTTVANALRVGDHLIERLGAKVSERATPKGGRAHRAHQSGESLA